MSVIKKCCVCDGNIVEGRCEKCGMPYQENHNFYHLNENRRDHVDHMSAGDKQEYARQQMGYGQQRPPVQTYAPQNNGQGRPDGAPFRGGVGSRQQQAARNGWVGVIIFIFILLFTLGPLLFEMIFG